MIKSFFYVLAVFLHCTESVLYDWKSIKANRNADNFLTHTTFLNKHSVFFLQDITNKLRYCCYIAIL